MPYSHSHSHAERYYTKGREEKLLKRITHIHEDDDDRNTWEFAL